MSKYLLGVITCSKRKLITHEIPDPPPASKKLLLTLYKKIQQQLKQRVDATKSDWASSPTQTNGQGLRVQVQLFKAARNIINMAHVSGTKEASTLTCTQIPAT